MKKFGKTAVWVLLAGICVALCAGRSWDLPCAPDRIFGGLALFVYGMTLMSGGLRQAAGDRLRNVMAYVTRNRFLAIATGALVTVLIQSSSATTVMTVGFVNAGLLSLTQAIGMVFGANVGTTITGQIVSFKLDDIALPAVLFGVMASFLAASDRARGFTRAALGFGMLFFGMQLMGAELKALSKLPAMAAAFAHFDCTPAPGGLMPFGAVMGALLAGTLTTMLVQSSSATIGITIALAGSGLISFWTAVPIVLGDNIGTTVTAFLAAAGGNRAARQTALAHSLFNVIGALAMIALFYVTWGGIPVFLRLVDAITAGDAFRGEAVGRHVAAAHSLFNIVNVVLLAPFIPALARLCERITAPRRDERAPAGNLLDANLLAAPSVAVAAAVRAAACMTAQAWRAARRTLEDYSCSRRSDMEACTAAEREIDDAQKDVTAYLVRISSRKITAREAHALPLLTHIVNDAERIGDLAMAVAHRTYALNGAAELSPAAKKALDSILDTVDRLAAATAAGLENPAYSHAAARGLALRLEHDSRRAVAEHARRLREGQCRPEAGMVYVEAIHAACSIARHLQNASERSESINNLKFPASNQHPVFSNQQPVPENTSGAAKTASYPAVAPAQ